MKRGHYKRWDTATVAAIGKKPADVEWLAWFNKAVSEGALRYDSKTDQWIDVRAEKISAEFREGGAA